MNDELFNLMVKYFLDPNYFKFMMSKPKRQKKEIKEIIDECIASNPFVFARLREI